MRRYLSRRFRRTTLMLVFMLSVLIGIGLSKTGTSAKLDIVLGLAIVGIYFIRTQSLLTLIWLMIFGLCLGCLRGAVFAQKLQAYKLLEKQKTTITVVAMNDAIYGKSKQLSFDANHVRLQDGRELTGKIQVSGFGINAVYQGDQIKVQGSFYKSYGAYQSSMSFATLQLIKHNPSMIADFRQKFTAGMQSALPEPLAPFAMGLLVGQRATLPAEIKQDLLMVGLTHIIAVSGYNLTIILNASRKLLSKQSKRLSTALSISLIIIFLLIAGASASIVRAAIVSMLSIWAGYYGRAFRPLNLIAFAAVITAWANPVYIWSDLSWYLSFLAFYGVMVLSPLIQKRWPARWQQSIAGGVALESVCAEIMSLPFILFIFGQMSLIGLVANVLVVALVPLAMLLSLIAGLAGMLVNHLAGWFSWPAVLLLNYMLDVAHLLARLPHIFIQNRSLSLIGMIIMYLLIITLSYVLQSKTKTVKPDIVTDINHLNA